LTRGQKLKISGAEWVDHVDKGDSKDGNRESSPRCATFTRPPFKEVKKEASKNSLYQKSVSRFEMRKNRPIIVGVSGSIGLLIIYFGILAWVNSLSHALEHWASQDLVKKLDSSSLQ
jgi:hypothetical protein